MNTSEFEREMFLAAGLMPRQAGDQSSDRGDGGQNGGKEAREDGKRPGRGGKHAGCVGGGGGGGEGEEMETGMFERELLVAAGRKRNSVSDGFGLGRANERDTVSGREMVIRREAVSGRDMVMRISLTYYVALY